MCEVIKGGHDVAGNPQAELDIEQVRHAIRHFDGKVEAVAISSFFSVRNPEHEQQVRELVCEMLDVPVVCGHELSTSLGFHERTVTCVRAGIMHCTSTTMASVTPVITANSCCRKFPATGNP